MKRLISLFLLAVIAILAVTGCAGKADEPSQDDWQGSYTFNPYYNRFKENPPTDKQISVSGKTFYFYKSEVRDKDELKLVDDETSLNRLYAAVKVVFSTEDTVQFKDSSKFFYTDSLKGERKMNVLTVENTNIRGNYTYDIRIEVQSEDLIYVIHNAHHYSDPCTYATLTFVSKEYLENTEE